MKCFPSLRLLQQRAPVLLARARNISERCYADNVIARKS